MRELEKLTIAIDKTAHAAIKKKIARAMAVVEQHAEDQRRDDAGEMETGS